MSRNRAFYFDGAAAGKALQLAQLEALVAMSQLPVAKALRQRGDESATRTVALLWPTRGKAILDITRARNEAAHLVDAAPPGFA